MKQDIFASTQTLAFHPIRKENGEKQTQYFSYLKHLLRLARWNQETYTKAQIVYYREQLCHVRENSKKAKELSFGSRFCDLLPYDLAAMAGIFHKEEGALGQIARAALKSRLILEIYMDFSLSPEQKKRLSRGFEAAFGDLDAWEDVLRDKALKPFRQYLRLVKQNNDFVCQKPYNILITATMSAGKSTLINALVGKTISLAQNMACTSKIHIIVSKPFEDGATSKYDHDLLMNASQEDLLTDNSDNPSSKITVGTYFNSALGGKRIVLLDSPGVNSSENADHTEISQKFIQSKKYRLMLYVLNATQLGTTDEERHLETVRDCLGQRDILFIMNKIDQLISEDDSILDSIENQRKFLISKGFQQPLICPVSSRAAYLAKKSRLETLSRLERREMEIYMDKFEQQGLPEYYQKHFGLPPISPTEETEALLANCGFSYLENQIVKFYTMEGK